MNNLQSINYTSINHRRTQLRANNTSSAAFKGNAPKSLPDSLIASDNLLRSRINHISGKLKESKIEHGVWIDSQNGSKILTETGDETTFDLTGSTLEKAQKRQKIKGSICIHNHPGDDIPYFSSIDLAVAYFWKLKELKLVTQDTIHTFELPKKKRGIPSKLNDLKQFTRKIWQDTGNLLYDKKKTELGRDLSENEINKKNYVQEWYDLIAERLSGSKFKIEDLKKKNSKSAL